MTLKIQEELRKLSYFIGFPWSLNDSDILHRCPELEQVKQKKNTLLW